MRIAQIAPLYEAVPPRFYGGTERVVANLSEALQALGHDVTVFASGDSATSAPLHPVRDCAIRLDSGPTAELAAHLVMLDQVLERADDFDILHFHIDCMPCALFRHLAQRTVTTLHGRLDLKDLQPFYERFSAFPLVSISDDQRRALPFANFVGTVHHGLPPQRFPWIASPSGDYLAFLGRISPEKRVDRAVEIATRAGVPLKIAAKIDRADEAYFREQIEPLFGHPLVEFVGEIGDADKPAFLGNAQALLFPIDWPEPFGLVMIEAMASGTPVIAFKHGSVPEVIDHGVTGFVVDDIESAVAAVGQIETLDRDRVRAVFDARFSAEAMARGYLRIYTRLLAEASEVRAITVSPPAAEREPAPLGVVATDARSGARAPEVADRLIVADQALKTRPPRRSPA